MGLHGERYAACRRCAVEHPDQTATPLAVLTAEPPGRGEPLLHKAVRARRYKPLSTHQTWVPQVRHFSTYEPVPLAPDPGTAVLLRCRRCGLRVGPISARRVAELFDRGHADGNVLLLPIPPSG